MSYRQPDSGDIVQDEIITLVDFLSVAKNLLTAANKQSFIIWFDKCNSINRRALKRYLEHHKQDIQPEFMKYAKIRFAGRLS